MAVKPAARDATGRYVSGSVLADEAVEALPPAPRVRPGGARRGRALRPGGKAGVEVVLLVLVREMVLLLVGAVAVCPVGNKN